MEEDKIRVHFARHGGHSSGNTGGGEERRHIFLTLYMVLTAGRGRRQLEFVDNKDFAGSSLVSGSPPILVQNVCLTKKVIIIISL